MNVGFYYMANAGGRLVGTLLSGLMFQVWGVAGCLWTSPRAGARHGRAFDAPATGARSSAGGGARGGRGRRLNRGVDGSGRGALPRCPEPREGLS